MLVVILPEQPLDGVGVVGKAWREMHAGHIVLLPTLLWSQKWFINGQPISDTVYGGTPSKVFIAEDKRSSHFLFIYIYKALFRLGVLFCLCIVTLC